MKKLATLLIILISFTAFGQKFDKGWQSDPLTTAEIQALPNPVNGLMRVNSDTRTIWLYENGSWVDTGSSSGTAGADWDTNLINIPADIADGDDDTQLTPTQVVAAVDSELGQTDWKTGGTGGSADGLGPDGNVGAFTVSGGGTVATLNPGEVRPANLFGASPGALADGRVYTYSHPLNSFLLTPPETIGTDDQQLTRTGNTLNLEDGGSVDLSDLAGGSSDVFDDKTPQLGGNFDALNNNITGVNLLTSQSARFGGADNLRSFNVKGSGINGRISIQGASINDNPGFELTVNDNASRILARLETEGADGTSFQIFTEPDGGVLTNWWTFTGDGIFDFSGRGLRKNGNQLQFQDAAGVWQDLGISGGGGFDSTASYILTGNWDFQTETSFNADVDFNNNKIVQLADPTNPQDAATKAYVDANGGGGDTSDTSLFKANYNTTKETAVSAGVDSLNLALSNRFTTGTDKYKNQVLTTSGRLDLFPDTSDWASIPERARWVAETLTANDTIAINPAGNITVYFEGQASNNAAYIHNKGDVLYMEKRANELWVFAPSLTAYSYSVPGANILTDTNAFIAGADSNSIGTVTEVGTSGELTIATSSDSTDGANSLSLTTNSTGLYLEASYTLAGSVVGAQTLTFDYKITGGGQSAVEIASISPSGNLALEILISDGNWHTVSIPFNSTVSTNRARLFPNYNSGTNGKTMLIDNMTLN